MNNGTAGVVDVTLEATSGATTVRSNGFTYTAIGQIDTVTPNNGQIGTSIEIVGARMLGGGAEASSVTLAGEAAFISSSTATKVEIIAVSGAAGTGDVVITSNTGAVVTSINGFTYTTAGAIATVTPNFGQVGTEVSIAGSALQGSGNNVATVTLAGEAASITSENDTLVVVAAAQGLAKTGDVVLTADSGAVITKSNGFTYRTEGNITGVSPSSGQIGTIVTIAGSALQGYGGSIVTVTLGSATATIVTETNTEAVIVATAGPTAETAVDVKLTSDSGAVVTSVNGFTYLEPGEISVVRPASGQVDTELVITGARLCGGGTRITNVSLAGRAADIIDDNCDLVNARANDLGAQITGDVVLTSDTGASGNQDQRVRVCWQGQHHQCEPKCWTGHNACDHPGQFAVRWRDQGGCCDSRRRRGNCPGRVDN